ncbi:MAG: rhomboid family intramembrane serine protease [Chloroflexota bacterium]
MTSVLIALNVAVFLLELVMEAQGQLAPFLARWTLVPAELTANLGQKWYTVFSATFLHVSWAHLLGNMLFLWLFGRPVEKKLGRHRFLLFYWLTGALATAVQVALNPTSPSPNLGASGGIAGILGGYVIQLTRPPENTPGRRLGLVVGLVALALWLTFDLVRVETGLGDVPAPVSTIALGAHLGGFLAGLLLIKPFVKRET